MDRNLIIREIKKYFDVNELVCDHTYAKWKENSWQFLDTEFLACLLVIRRDIIKKPMYCNGNSAHQRGLRCNRCPMVRQKPDVYLSSHLLGKAGDFSIPGLSNDNAKAAQLARNLIKMNQALLPFPIRMESGVSWLHFDVLPQYGIIEKVHEFSA